MSSEVLKCQELIESFTLNDKNTNDKNTNDKNNSDKNTSDKNTSDKNTNDNNADDSNCNNNTNDTNDTNDNDKKNQPRRTLNRRYSTTPIPIINDLTMFTRKSDTLTLADVRCVTNQLRYEPMNIIDIGAYSSSNEPIVAILYPLLVNDLKGNYPMEEGYKPFPTTMWITCPKLHTRISKLEDQGWVIKLKDKLLQEDNKEYLQIMHDAHQKYAQFRWSLLSLEDKEFIENKGWTYKLRDVGIAGMASFNAIKCLHGHYAHYKCKPEHNNIVGKWIDELLKTIPEEP